MCAKKLGCKVATITEVNGKTKTTYKVCIRLGEYRNKPLYKTFSKKTIAKQWARKKEAEIEAGKATDTRQWDSIPFTELLDRYEIEYVSTCAKSTRDRNKYIISKLKVFFASKRLGELREEDFTSYGVGLLARMSPDGMENYFKVLCGLYDYAETIWKFDTPNFPKNAKSGLAKKNRLKGLGDERMRRLAVGEYEKVRAHHIGNIRLNLIKYGALLAVETGMRRGEIAAMDWSNVDLVNTSGSFLGT